ncbi:MAG TPA: ribonuclease Y [Thermomicrobiales bacterium]|nr:ribonuclease Y [Thermomicrobiales bacterium]
MSLLFIVLLLLGWLVVGVAVFAATYFWLQYRAAARMKQARQDADEMLEQARNQQKELIIQGKDEALRFRTDVDREYRERRAEVTRLERRLQQKEEAADKKAEAMERRERALQTREKELDATRADLEGARERQLRELERVAQLTADDAKHLLLSEIETEVREIAARKIREIEQETKEEANRRAMQILATAVQRCAPDYVAESTVSVIPLPSDDMKGRIIGREGRNIRALEAATHVDVIIDDTPEAITVSCFDAVRREIARRALAKLVQDGRIHPARIEEVVQKAEQEVEQVMQEEGDHVAYEANVQGLHPELIRLLGRLKYRTSYGQNVLQHSLECSLIAAGIAAELGADINVAKTAALLHDIGKAVDHEVEGPHALIGAEIAKRLGRSPRIVHAIAAHHGEEEPQTVEAFIVATADGISGGRPGARRDMLERYIQRLEALEGVANSFEGVDKSFAIQAGREVRILVRPDNIDDLGATRLARDVAKKIEETLEYPGQIKVTVIRETRSVDYAR